jgi:hypothetical protein
MNINKNVAVSDSGFVFNPTTGESFSANPIGTEIIEMLKQGKTKDEIKENILENYNTEEDVVDKDVFEFYELLKQYSLLD